MSDSAYHRQSSLSQLQWHYFFLLAILAWNLSFSPDVQGQEAAVSENLKSEFLEPEMIQIPAGPFIAGSSEYERALYFVPRHEPASHIIDLPTYWIGRYEVSFDQYKCFVDNGGYRTSDYWSPEGWQACEQFQWTKPRRWHDKVYGNIRKQIMPVSAISWYEAEAYCRWLSQKTGKSYRLPTENEWEKAARGTDGRIFPWGNEWGSNKCNGFGFLGEMEKTNMPLDPYADISPLGSFEEGKSPWGCYDMAGNVLEWCSDPWSETHTTYRVFRGGCYLSNYPRLFRCAWRGGTYPDTGHVYWGIIGFRVAMDETEKETH